MARIKFINNISGLQYFNFLRFITFLLISIFFTKSGMTTEELGDFEFLIFVAGVVSYFWLTGLIQTFLPLYNNNASFPGEKIDANHKSPEIFNAFLLISAFSVIVFLFGHIAKYYMDVVKKISSVPRLNLTLTYILLSNPAHLIEYIYVLRNKSRQIFKYATLTFSLQLVAVCLPVALGYGIEKALYGLIYISVFRILWLIALLRKYAKFEVSYSFMKSHIRLALPLIVTTLLTGSAQYIDGLIVAFNFDGQSFAQFRYGAKELPLVTTLAGGLSSALLPEFYNTEKLKSTLKALREKSKKLMHILFPFTFLLLFFSDYFFPKLFNENFGRSSDVFMVYLLMITNRLLFPHTIFIGLKRTNTLMYVAVIGLVVNIVTSLLFINEYGLVGVALGTLLAYSLEKILLVTITYFKFGISPTKYTPIVTYIIYTAILTLLFVAIDRDIIMVFGR